MEDPRKSASSADCRCWTATSYKCANVLRSHPDWASSGCWASCCNRLSGTPNGICNKSATFIVLALARNGQGSEQHERILAASRILPASRFSVQSSIDGFNASETAFALLESGYQFANLSRNTRPSLGWHWGALANYLTHMRVLRRQVEQRTPYMVTLEEDVVPTATFLGYVQRACDHYERIVPQPSLLSLSQFNEIRITSLDGAASILEGVRRYGIQKNSDQTLNDPAINLHSHSVQRMLRGALADERKPPWNLERNPNSGNIKSTRRMTPAEVTLLRLLSASYGDYYAGGPFIVARRILRNCCNGNGSQPILGRAEPAGLMHVAGLCDDRSACDLAAESRFLLEVAGWQGGSLQCGTRKGWRKDWRKRWMCSPASGWTL